QRLALRRKAANQLGQLRSQLLLPCLSLCARGGLETKAPRRGGVQIAREGDGIESSIVEALRDTRERTDISGGICRLRSERQSTERRQGRQHPRELAPRHFSHGGVFLRLSTMEKIAVLAPMPRARDRMAIADTIGVARSVRIA